MLPVKHSLSRLTVITFASALTAVTSSAQISTRAFEIYGDTGVAANGLLTFHADTGWLDININNLSGTGGYANGVLTSFGFDTPSNLSYVGGSFSQSLAAGSEAEPFGISFSVSSNYNLSPYGTLEIGAITGPNAAGGNSKAGLSGGYSANFSFQFSGDYTAGLLDNMSSDQFFATNDSESPDMLFRFQSVGPRGEDSDKVTYFDLTPIPEAASFGWAATLMLGLSAALGRRRRACACAGRLGVLSRP